MKHLFLLLLTALSLPSLALSAQEDWPTTLARMPLQFASRELDRTNCVELTLRSLQPNSVVKGIVFLPCATDEIYLTRHVQPHLASTSATLLDAVHSLTNGTGIRATFRPPLLLLHTQSDPLEPIFKIAPEASMPALSPGRVPSPVVFVDRDWDRVEPVVRKSFGIDVQPREGSKDSWHFYRLNLVGIGLDAREMVEAICLASKTHATLEQHRGLFGKHSRLVFSADRRAPTH